MWPHVCSLPNWLVSSAVIAARHCRSGHEKHAISTKCHDCPGPLLIPGKTTEQKVPSLSGKFKVEDGKVSINESWVRASITIIVVRVGVLP